jgi:hypothetical protein
MQLMQPGSLPEGARRRLNDALSSLRAISSTPEMFGALGDAGSDDRGALQDALSQARAVVLSQGATYRIDAALAIESGTILRGNAGAALVPGVARTLMVDIGGAEPTAWSSLVADAEAGATSFQLASNPGFALGDWVELRSSALIEGANSQGGKVSRLRRVTAVTGTSPVTLYIHKPLPEAYRAADSAVAGKATVVENVLIEDLQLNTENFTTLIGFGIRLNYVADVQIVRPRIFGSKTPGGDDAASYSAIKIMNSVGVTVHDPELRHIGWYGVEVVNAAEDVQIFGGRIEDARHAVSVNWTDGYGEPVDVLVSGVAAVRTTLSGFDTHDMGKNVRFIDCVSDGAGDDGFQFRNIGSTAIGCVGRNSARDGFGGETSATFTRLIGCAAINNQRVGYRFLGPVSMTDCDGSDHTGPISGYGGVELGAGGEIRGGRFTGNGNQVIRMNADAALRVEGIYAPADVVQTACFRAFTTLGGRYNQVVITDSNLVGYADNSLFSRNQSARGAGDLPPITSGNQLKAYASGAESQGQVALVAGSATVSTTAARKKTGINFAEDILSSIILIRVAAGGTVGDLYVESVSDGVNFTIKSTSNLDTSTVQWRVSV